MDKIIEVKLEVYYEKENYAIRNREWKANKRNVPKKIKK